MKGTNVTPEQLARAEEFLRDVADWTPPWIRTSVTLELGHLIRLLSWYGAIRANGARAGIVEPRGFADVSNRITSPTSPEKSEDQP